MTTTSKNQPVEHVFAWWLHRYEQSGQSLAVYWQLVAWARFNGVMVW